MSNRNAIKYRPFAAVEGHAEAIEALHKKAGLIDKPIVGEDHIERINRALLFSIQTKSPIILKVFNKGKIESYTDTIIKHNNISKTLLLSDNTKINIDDIVDVQ
ncbi:MAG: YolD-like family protein [bacterium]